eukprot:69217_1
MNHTMSTGDTHTILNRSLSTKMNELIQKCDAYEYEELVEKLKSDNESITQSNVMLKQKCEALQERLDNSLQQIHDLNELESEYNAVINDLEEQINILHDAVNKQVDIQLIIEYKQKEAQWNDTRKHLERQNQTLRKRLNALNHNGSDLSDILSSGDEEVPLMTKDNNQITDTQRGNLAANANYCCIICGWRLW